MVAYKKLLLFDIDGTLLNSHGATRAAKQSSMIDVFGLDGDVLDYPFGGKTDWQILNELLVPRGFDPIEIGQKMPHYERVFAAHLRRVIGNFRVEALPGTLKLVQKMHRRKDVMVGLVTGNTSATAPIKLEAAGFDPAMFVVGAFGNESDDRNELPKIAMHRAAHHALGVPFQPQDVIIIGDTLADIACARANDAVAVAVLTGHGQQQALSNAKPDYLLDDLTYFESTVKLN